VHIGAAEDEHTKTPHVTIRGRVGEISIPIVEALPTTEHTLLVFHCLAAEQDGLIKTKERKKVHG